MLIDGKTIAGEIRSTVSAAISRRSVPPHLAIVVVGDNPVIESFVRIKKRVGEELHVRVSECRLSSAVSMQDIASTISLLAEDASVDGIVIQLPLPEGLVAEDVLNLVPVQKDVDMLSAQAMANFRMGVSVILPPVAGAVQEILERAKVDVVGKEVLILGYGRLVGKPVSILLRHNHAHVTVIDKPVADLGIHVRESDVVISGVGHPSLIKPEMLKAGAVLIDAGTSEQGGKIVGDADPECALAASVFTPVPGGVGPIAIAMLFKNLAILAGSADEKR